MSGADLDFGSLNDTLGAADPYRNVMGWLESEDEFRRQHPDVVDAALKAPKTGTVNLMRSAGPISDRYILSAAPATLITGPGGSGKTIASGKKALFEAQRMRPGPDGVRRHVLGTFRQKYVNVWKATIPSWWKLFPRQLAGSKWAGSSPREAEHILTFQDRHGTIVLTNRFRAFGDTADPEDVLGNEFTDCYLNEWSTLPWQLFVALIDRVGREPPIEISGRTGRFWGDSNAPDVLSDIYREFYERKTPGYALLEQPSGLSPEAENIEAVGRAYYINSAAMNVHRPWWIKRMIHNMPGFTRDNDPVYPKYDDARNMAPAPIAPLKELPIIVGVDGGLTPAAAYCQERPNGGARTLAEVALERGGMRELATAMLALEARRFDGCTFHTVCDPAMGAGEDTEDSSDRARLAKHLGRKVKLARTQEVAARIEAVAAKFDLTLENGVPGYLLDPSCKGLRRGKNQTFHFRAIQGSDDRGAIAKTFDGHVSEAEQYAYLEFGSAEAKRRTDEIAKERVKRRQEARRAPRYNPFGHWNGPA
jgi:hypothetical protein